MFALKTPIEMECLEGFRDKTTVGGEGTEEDGDGGHCFAELFESDLPFVDFVEETKEEDYQKGEEDLARKRHQELSGVEGLKQVSKSNSEVGESVG